jgi:hypothetical protein
VENSLVVSLQWPSWALRLIATLTVIVLLTAVVEHLVTSRRTSDEFTQQSETQPTWSFRYFQLQYLSVFLLTMLADWLQGTNMYTLYMVSDRFNSVLLTSTLSKSLGPLF